MRRVDRVVSVAAYPVILSLVALLAATSLALSSVSTASAAALPRPGISQGDFTGPRVHVGASLINDWSWLRTGTAGSSRGIGGLKINQLRVFVPWDLADSDARRQRMFGRMLAASKGRAEILVTLKRGCGKTPISASCPNQTKRVPVKRYVAAVKRMLSKYPQIKYITPWNEPNYGRPYGGSAGASAAAELAFALRQEVCVTASKCQIVAGDFAGEHESVVWRHYAKTYLKSLQARFRRAGALNRMPTIWGFHPYWDVWELRGPKASRDLYQFMSPSFTPARARIWVTEVGSRIDWSDNRGTRGQLSAHDMSEPAHGNQQSQVDYLVNDLALTRRGSKRVARLYYYSLCSVGQSHEGTIADYGLVGQVAYGNSHATIQQRCEAQISGEQRPAFHVFKEFVQRAGP